jgi:hypothetical protein
MDTLRSHDLHNKNLVKTLFLYQWNDDFYMGASTSCTAHMGYNKKPYMIYSKYIDNLVETYDAIRIYSEDTERDSSRILIKEG